MLGTIAEFERGFRKGSGREWQGAGPFQLFAGGHQTFSNYWGSKRSIDAIRMETVERFRQIVLKDTLSNSVSVAADGADENQGTAAENEPAVAAAMPVPRVAPPVNARYLLSLALPARDRQAIVGDLIEEYHAYVIPEFGTRRAKIWFWTQTAKSIMPILSRRFVRAAAGLAGRAAQKVGQTPLGK